MSNSGRSRGGEELRRIGEQVVSRGVGLAERGVVPDPLIRSFMRRVIRARLDSITSEHFPAELGQNLWSGPIAVETDVANRQHYEVPPEFFALVLGPRLKYSCALWSEGVGDLGAAEEAMLRLYEERASLQDGQTILDLGCGWGSLSLWLAERYRESEVLAVSNSQQQGEFIEKRAADLGLDNLRVETADINHFEPKVRFDRILSIEMLEHVRNHRLLFSRATHWLEDDGLMFTHVFAHRDHSYPYETNGAADWMARTFFTGGVMPSRSLLPEAASPQMAVQDEWWVDGSHYARTCEAWLERLDDSRSQVDEALAPTYGSGEVAVWVQRWRMFFMACAEMFAFDAGRQWGVVHQTFRPVG
jgi:cyclopropane-fatty-acyl-phospholipid synthase